MRNITLSADEAIIERARERARLQETTLNALFRNWIANYAAEPDAQAGYQALMSRLEAVHAGGTFSRDERNER